MADLLLKNFTMLARDELELVLSWRNEERVRRMMVDPEPIALERHLEFVGKLPSLTDRRYYLALIGETPVGVIDITCMLADKSSCNPGLYTGTGSPMGTGLLLSLLMLHGSYDRFGYRSVWSFVKKDNESFSEALVRMFRMQRLDEGGDSYRLVQQLEDWKAVGGRLMSRLLTRFGVERIVWRDPEGETVSYGGKAV